MKLLEDKILSEGKIGAGDVLKVDCFLNHRIDVAFLSELGKEFHRLYKDEGINKILTMRERLQKSMEDPTPPEKKRILFWEQRF